MSPRARAVIATVIATAGFSAALVVRDRLDPWLCTGIAAAVSIAASVWALGRPQLRSLLRVEVRGAMLAALLGVGLVVATHVVFRAVSHLLGDHVRSLYISIDVDTPRATLMAITLGVVVAEELVWRGAAIAMTTGRLARPASGLVSVLLYVIPQLLGGEWILVLAAMGLGAVFTLQRLASDRLIEPLITHAMWSVSIFVAFPLA
jgi:membrane protease YdiL (CAAX protease family)